MAHLRMTGRVFENGRLIGYEVTDGNEVRKLSKEEAWVYARRNLIENVRASGPVSKLLVTGTNGFEIKKLPEIRLNTTMNIQQQNQTSNIDKLSANTGNNFEADTAKKVYSSNYGSSKNNIQLVSELATFHRTKLVSFPPRLHGYVVRNVSNEVQQIQRIPFGGSKEGEQVVIIQLKPGETAYLSKAELIALALKAEFMKEFANAVVKKSTDNTNSKSSYETIKESHYIVTDKPLEKLNIKKVVPEKELKKYFGLLKE